MTFIEVMGLSYFYNMQEMKVSFATLAFSNIVIKNKYVNKKVFLFYIHK